MIAATKQEMDSYDRLAGGEPEGRDLFGLAGTVRVTPAQRTFSDSSGFVSPGTVAIRTRCDRAARAAGHALISFGLRRTAEV